VPGFGHVVANRVAHQSVTEWQPRLCIGAVRLRGSDTLLRAIATRLRNLFLTSLRCNFRLPKIFSQDIQADEEHPQRKGQRNPLDGSDAQQEN